MSVHHTQYYVNITYTIKCTQKVIKRIIKTETDALIFSSHIPKDSFVPPTSESFGLEFRVFQDLSVRTCQLPPAPAEQSLCL